MKTLSTPLGKETHYISEYITRFFLSVRGRASLIDVLNETNGCDNVDLYPDDGHNDARNMLI
jgi:hypothetical protein